MLSEIKIGRHVVPIEIVSEKALPENVIGEYKLRGSYSINVSEELVPLLQAEVVAHEIVHGWLHVSGIGNLFDPNIHETLCDAFAPYLAQLIDDMESKGEWSKA